ncbi:MAG TPA: hypothetical protein VIZ43_30390 [Trebonia sp.]
MSSTADDKVTSINAAYLKTLVQYFLQPLLDEVDGLLKPGQMESMPGSSYSVQIPQLNGSLSVPAGPSDFKPASDLVNALGQVGSSVNADLTWFKEALSDTIDEINTTVASMSSTDDLNAEQAQTILTDFAGAIGVIDSSPTGGSGGGGSGGGSAASGSGSGG